MTDLRLASINGEPIIEVGPIATHEEMIAASFIGIGESVLSGKLAIEQAIVVAVIDGMLTYTPIGSVTVVEGIGLLELASRKIERDASQ